MGPGGVQPDGCYGGDPRDVTSLSLSEKNGQVARTGLRRVTKRRVDAAAEGPKDAIGDPKWY